MELPVIYNRYEVLIKFDGSNLILPGIKVPISLQNILWASIKKMEQITLEISMLVPNPKTGVARLQVMYYEVNDEADANIWAEKVMSVAYEGLKPQKNFYILLNPYSGKGTSRRALDKYVLPVLNAARCSYHVQVTEHRGHAEELTRNLNIQDYDAVISVGGDGLLFEVINGLLKREDAFSASKLPLCVIPTGSGNALSISMHGEKQGFSPVNSTLAAIKGTPLSIDICSITQGKERYFSFLSQNFGIAGDADLGTDKHLKWMGDTRFTVGALYYIMRKKRYPCELSMLVEHAELSAVKEHYRLHKEKNDVNGIDTEEESFLKDKYGDIDSPVPENWHRINGDLINVLGAKCPLLGRGMLSHPYALPDDGLLDMVILEPDSTLNVLGIFDKLSKGAHVESRAVKYYKVKAFRLTPKLPKGSTKGYLSIDGESMPFEPFQAEVHRRVVKVMSLNGGYIPVDI
ncbi:uncharacterized protein VTP21DRAFT_1477 [Calcarisporiella thermophila]|uniref:uncharacterized protein n=1 Tax=Calcarisporiella thermophila TaxID=911321 RepID=UPI0037428400